MKKYSRVVAEISYNAIDHNFALMASKLKPGTRIIAVVKADCYGHGAVQIARRIHELPYIWGFACATPEEAMQLRYNGIRKPIILLGYAFPESYEDLIDYDVRPCVFDLESARALSHRAGMLGHQVRVHIAVDTGMGRIGFQPTEESADIVREISLLPDLEIEGLFTHFARADEPDIAPAKEQLARYRTFRSMLDARGVRIPLCHVSNSAGIMRFQEANLDLVRAGITIYGLMPSDDVASEMTGLMPAMTLKSHLTFVKTLPKGSPVSYGGTYVTQGPTRIATVPVGYADGYPRQLSGRGWVLIRGRRAPITGRVCMDQFMVDVTGIPDASVGDEAVLLGTQGEERITAEQLGRISGRFNYELVSLITKRVPRSYILDGTVMEQVDYFK